MPMGRIRRGKRGPRGQYRKVHVEVLVGRADTYARSSGGYEARACFRTNVGHGPGASPRSPVLSCGDFQNGRTPQSAIAKALKDFAQTVALRNPGKHTGHKTPRWYKESYR